MATDAPVKPTSSPPSSSRRTSSVAASPGDSVFVTITIVFALVIIALVIIFAVNLFASSIPSFQKNGLSFYTSIDWSRSTVNDEEVYNFGALNFIYASVVTSIIALIIGGVLSIGAAIYLAEYAPPWLRTGLGFTIELLAAIPSIIYGFWGVQILSPILGGSIEPFLKGTLGSFIPMFSGNALNTAVNPARSVPVNITGRDILTAGLILSIMIMPIVTSITRDVLRTVPDSQREGMLAMGATKWQAITKAVLPFGKGGIVGAIILGLGRAIGETVAVAYLIGGGSALFGTTLFLQGETLPAKISNSVAEITPISQPAIIQLGFTLFVITLIVNMIARYLVTRTGKKSSKTPTGLAAIWSNISRWVGLLFFPVAVVLLSPFISLPIAAIIIVVWGGLKIIRYLDTQAATAGRPYPRFLQVIGNPNKSYPWRKGYGNVMGVLVMLAALIAIVPLGSILITTAINGLPVVLRENFLIANQTPVNVNDRGILHAMTGTLFMTLIGSVIGIPIGILAGIYLSEFGRGRFADIVRFTADVLQGIPSIIIGLVAYTLIVQPRLFAPKDGSPLNGIAGSIALGVMIIPIITRNTEEILKLVPQNMREAALALGVPRWKTTVTVVIPAAFSGVMTGVILGVARIAGETAPLLYTAGGGGVNSFTGIDKQTPALTLFIFSQSKDTRPEQVVQLWGAAFVLVFVVMVLTLGVRYFTRNKLGTRLSN